MSTGSLSEAEEELPEMELRGLRELGLAGLSKRRPSLGHSSAEEEEEEEEEEEVARKKKRSKGPSVGKRASASSSSGEGKQSQRNAANARERARMRVLSKAFSRLKTSLPWVPPDTKLSKLDTLRLASSYIAHLRQLLHEDHRYEKGAGGGGGGGGYVHPVNLTWPFVVSGRPESDTKEVSATNRLCGTTV